MKKNKNHEVVLWSDKYKYDSKILIPICIGGFYNNIEGSTVMTQ